MFSVIVPAHNSEKYIHDTLNSLTKQSYQNFEVIIVNDGSTDSTQSIIDNYCDKYPTFISTTQKNQGVAAARNTGMKLAKGDYIAFLDSDGDMFTRDALKHFNDTIVNNGMPEMVIGRQKMVNLWTTHNYANAKWLSNSKKIEPHNKWIIWTMSLMNKVFSRKKILEIGLEMPLLSYASDGAFVLPFAYSCDNIVGCPHDIIIYNKRMLFDEYSISQTSTMKTLNDYLKVHEIIHEEFLKYSENYRKKYANDTNKLINFEDDYLIYLDALIHRQAAILISQFYRFFWRTDLEVLEKVKKCIKSFKSLMFPTSWEKLKKGNKDLNLEDLIIEKDEMSNNPIVSIAIDKSIKEESLLQMLQNIHNSHFPSFEVFLTEESFLNLPSSFKKREYIKTLEYVSDDKFKNEIIDKANGKFLLYLDRFVLMSPDILNKMFDKLYNSHYDFTVMSVKYSFKKDKPNGTFHEDKFLNKVFFAKDNFSNFSNKLFKLDFLRDNKFEFTNNTKNDVNNIYEIGDHSNIKSNLILDIDTFKIHKLFLYLLFFIKLFVIIFKRLLNGVR